MEKELFTIGQAAEYLGVSLNTLRRWDQSGKLVAIKINGGTHRYYRLSDLEFFTSDLVKLASNWVIDGLEFPSQFYCANSAIFQARLIKMQDLLIKVGTLDNILPLIVAVTGEIGNNSFDHNLGKWPDTQGIFFGYNINKQQIVLADRGLGVFATLSRVKPELKNHTEALRVAFTEIISGRAPEVRGNGLKFVRQVITESTIRLFFKSGDAELRLKKDNNELLITRSPATIQGCLAIIEF